MAWMDDETEWTPAMSAFVNEMSKRAAMSLKTITESAQKISETPYVMVCDLKPGDGEVGRLYGFSVDMASGCDMKVERKPYSGDAGDETE